MMNDLGITKKINSVKRRINKRIVGPLIRPLYIDYRPDYRNSILLAGTQRSGTTWVSDIINYKREYRYIFEPFWSRKVDTCRKLKPEQYLRPENRDSYFIRATEAILSGRVRNKWMDRYHRRFIVHKRLIKDVRANLFLKWIHCHFPEIPIIFLLRHPCAVASSQLRSGHRFPSPKEEFLTQAELVEDYLSPFKEEIKEVQTDFEQLIFRWCIQNYVPLKQFRKGEICPIFYENMCEAPASEIKKLFSFLGKNFDEIVLAQSKRPSPQARTESAIISGGSLIDNWRRHVTAEQIQSSVEILRLFGLDKIYSAASTPNVDGLYQFMAED